MYTNQFEIPNASMEDIKIRVKSWLSSFEGTDYFMEIVNERHVKISKTKLDNKICGYGCITYCLATVGAPFILIAARPTNFTAAISLIFGYMLLIMMIIPIFMGLYCLKPNKVEFDVRFSHEHPIRVMIVASGNMLEKAQYDYDSFLNALRPGSFDAGIGL